MNSNKISIQLNNIEIFKVFSKNSLSKLKKENEDECICHNQQCIMKWNEQKNYNSAISNDVKAAIFFNAFWFMVPFIFHVKRDDRKQMVLFEYTVIKSFIALVTLVGIKVIEICKLYGGLYADLMHCLFVKTSIQPLRRRRNSYNYQKRKFQILIHNIRDVISNIIGLFCHSFKETLSLVLYDILMIQTFFLLYD